MGPTEIFTAELENRFKQAKLKDKEWLVVKAGELEKATGLTNRIVLCCGVMVAAMMPGDVVMASPPSGHSTTFKVFYWMKYKGRNRPL